MGDLAAELQLETGAAVAEGMEDHWFQVRKSNVN